MKTSQTAAKFWLYMNKNGFIGMSFDKPERNEKTGKWVSKYPYCNSIMHAQIVDMIAKSQFSWQNEPEYIEINFEK